MVKAYLDTSVIMALLTDDPSTKRADAFFRTRKPIPMVSGFAAAEFASALGRRVRVGETDVAQAHALFSAFDDWIVRVAHRVAPDPSDLAAAATFPRRLDLTLRTPDALHIAICWRHDADLVTFDAKMANVAATLGLRVAAA